MRPLAIIECDLNLAATLQSTLQSAGFHADCFHTANAALPRLRANEFALAIIGLDRRDADAYAICSEVSQHVPVITLTSACGEDVCVRALECGADDCIQSRTSGREVVARIRNVLRRSDAPDHALAQSFEISLSEMRVRSTGTTHNLTFGETQVLSLLVAHAPTPITASRIAALLGARRGTVEGRLKSLRAKLGAGRLISRGSLGYQLADE